MQDIERNRWCNLGMSACYQKGTCGHGLIRSNESTDALFQRSLRVYAQKKKKKKEYMLKLSKDKSVASKSV